jgi:hypothetical protein
VFENLVLTDREFCNVSDMHGRVTGFQVKLRIPQYRGLPLSMLQDLRVTVDGEIFQGEKLRILYEGHNYSLEDLKPLHDLYWCYEKFIKVLANKPGGLSTGMHTVEVRLLLDTGPPNVPRMRAWDIAKDADLLAKTYENSASGTGMAKVTKKMTLVQ